MIFKGSANDPETTDLSGDDLVWNSSLDGNIGNGTEFNISNISIGVHEVTLTAQDPDNFTSQITINFTINSAPPIVAILSPNSGDVFSEGEDVLFNGTANDFEDGNLTGASLVWSSDGSQIGTGNSFTLSNLSTGTHTIILNATDSHGVSITESRIITISGFGQNTLNVFSDGLSTAQLDFSSPGLKTVYVRLPRGSNITNATLQVEGFSHED